jgi:hypothetical protein
LIVVFWKIAKNIPSSSSLVFDALKPLGREVAQKAAGAGGQVPR